MELRAKMQRMLAWALMVVVISASVGVGVVRAAKAHAPGDPGITIVDSSDADTDGDTAIFKGTYIEYAVYKNGCFGAQQIANSDLINVYKLHPIKPGIDTIGFIYDFGKDGWNVGSIPQTGDLFMPGGPYESWGLIFTLNGTQYGAGCTKGGRDISDGTIPSPLLAAGVTGGTMSNAIVEETTLAAYPGKKVIKQSADVAVTTSGGLKSDALKIEQYFISGLDDTKITMLLKVTNNSGDPMTNLTYTRSLDPDPVRELDPITYESYNVVTQQGPTFAEVRAYGSDDPSNDFYPVGIALGAVSAQAYTINVLLDNDWVLSDNKLAVGSRPALGDSMWGDNAMRVLVPYGNLATGADTTFQSYYNLNVMSEMPATPTPTAAPGSATATPKPGSATATPQPGVKPLVKVLGISPKTGPITGGTLVTINGLNFSPSAKVTFGGIEASCTFVSSTKLVCTAPAHVLGLALIAVNTSQGTGKYMGFTYINGPSLPDTGFAQGQVSVLPKQPADRHYNSTALRLVIPSLKVNAEIVGVPVAGKGWDVAWLGTNAGYLQGSAFPTWLGNSVITGHVWNANNTPGIFVNLKNMKYGERFSVVAFGSTYTYEVRESLPVKAWDSAALLKHYEDKSWITLVTCEDYLSASKSYQNRRLVRAVLISVQ